MAEVGEIKEGDVVMLKSGGPKMTVCVSRQSSVYCEWFDHEENYHARDFEHNSLLIDAVAPDVQGPAQLVG